MVGTGTIRRRPIQRRRRSGGRPCRPLGLSVELLTLLAAGCYFTGNNVHHRMVLAEEVLATFSVSVSNPYNHKNGHGVGGVSSPTPIPLGPIEDAQCDVEQLEHANDAQLYAILNELSQTSFFRTFAVDLDHGCPVWSKRKDEQHAVATAAAAKDEVAGGSAAAASAASTEAEGEGTVCASAGLPDFAPEEHDGQPACGVTTDDDDGGGGGDLAMLLAGGEKGIAAPSKPLETKKDQQKQELPRGGDGSPTLQSEADETDDEDDDDEEEEWECEGTDELEDEPLCEVKDENDLEQVVLTPLKEFFSSALRSIAEAVGWESDSQRDAFAWTRPSDPIVETSDDGNCSGDLPDTFWVDMCSEIKAGDGLKVVNLALNPERNTGYNGTHIWRAIYEENCLSVDGNVSVPMCYEERVLYRLLSGLHTSTTISIAKNYLPPSKRKGRVNWEPNATYFMEKFVNHPERIRNLHFSYVVLLRALRKAKPLLYDYEIRTGDIVDDETATVLLRRLLDSHILRSCQDVFSAFDESLMFNDVNDGLPKEARNVTLLRRNFKGVFHNISSILDCVQCQQCKLHGKMAMLGYGAALKVLFLPPQMLGPNTLTRNEIVAFVQTAAKMSESIKEIRELTHLYWAERQSIGGEEDVRRLPPAEQRAGAGVVGAGTVGVDDGGGGGISEDPGSLVDAAVGAIRRLNLDGKIDDDAEEELVRMALGHDPDLLTLAKYYSSDLTKFLRYSSALVPKIGSLVAVEKEREPDAIVVGSGLAGLAASLNILDRGGRVVLLEKEHRLGGNSAKASSGINACCPHNDTYGDTLQSFTDDTVRSAGGSVRLPLIETLTGNSAEAVRWLQSRAGVDLSLLAQLGGHSHKRTHRPNNGMAGAEIIYGMQREVKKYEKTGRLRIIVDARVTRLIYDGSRVTGVEYVGTATADGAEVEGGAITAPNVVLATGGFASDRSDDSYLASYRPELLRMSATAGDFSTGDGIRLATELGAGLVDMDKVQIHPTGWIDPADPVNPSKILAAELMRGVGGMLLNDSGERFCNELGTRAYVTDKMLGHDPHYQATKRWDPNSEVPIFSLVLSSSAALDGKKHVDLYTHKGLLTKIDGVDALASWMGVDVDVVRRSLKQYRDDSIRGVDEWGKTSFRGVPDANLDGETFYAGRVTPVLHYCMGGVTIDTDGNVLDTNKNVIPGLHAAGEVSGGVHGDNRLGGNSLLECTVYGTIVGKKIPIAKPEAVTTSDGPVNAPSATTQQTKSQPISVDELARHNSDEDCWVAIHGDVYDLTEFAEEHPPGAESIFKLAGQDGTEAFQAVHNRGMLDDFSDDKVGVLVR